MSQFDNGTAVSWPLPAYGLTCAYEPPTLMEPGDDRAGPDHGSTRNKLVLVVENQEFMKGCLVSWLRSSCSDLQIASTSAPENLLGLQLLGPPAAAIVTENPVHQGIEWLEQEVTQIHALFPEVPIIAIVVSPRTVTQLSKLGLQGYIPTSTPPAVAAAALRLVMAGGVYLPPAEDGECKTPLVSPGPTTGLTTKLSPRERAVADRIGRGMQNKLIAYELDMSLSTVKAHVHSIIKKLKVANRTEVAVMARTGCDDRRASAA